MIPYLGIDAPGKAAVEMALRSELMGRVMSLLESQRGGCGCGRSSRALARARVLGRLVVPFSL